MVLRNISPSRARCFRLQHFTRILTVSVVVKCLPVNESKSKKIKRLAMGIALRQFNRESVKTGI